MVHIEREGESESFLLLVSGGMGFIFLIPWNPIFLLLI